MSDEPDLPRVMRTVQHGRGPTMVAAEVIAPDMKAEPAAPATPKDIERSRWARTHRAVRVEEDDGEEV